MYKHNEYLLTAPLLVALIKASFSSALDASLMSPHKPSIIHATLEPHKSKSSWGAVATWSCIVFS